MQVRIDFDRELLDAFSACKQKNYSNAYVVYEKISLLLPPNSDENKLHCDLGKLVCQLAFQNIDLDFAQKKFDELEKYRGEIKHPCSQLINHLTDQCQNTFKKFNNPIQRADYYYSYIKKAFVRIMKEEKMSGMIAAIENIKKSTENALNLYFIYKKSRTVIDDLNHMLISLVGLLADNHFDISKDHALSEMIRMDHLQQAIEYYKNVIKMFNGTSIDKHSVYADKVIPSHFSILHAWYVLATEVDQTNRQCYVQLIHSYMNDNKLQDLANRLFDTDNKNEYLGQLDQYALFCQGSDETKTNQVNSSSKEIPILPAVLPIGTLFERPDVRESYPQSEGKSSDSSQPIEEILSIGDDPGFEEFLHFCETMNEQENKKPRLH